MSVAVITDAGTPGISDPGEEIVKNAIENNIEIIPIPGASAFVNALICSGLSTREFTFVGFLPTNNKEKKDKLEELKNENRTLIFYEAPHKIKNTLENILEIFGNRKIVLARELTKIHEEFIRVSIEELIDKAKSLKGEMILLIEGAKKVKKENFLNELSLDKHYEFYEKQGLEKKEIIKRISKDRGVNKNEIYKKFI